MTSLSKPSIQLQKIKRKNIINLGEKIIMENKWINKFNYDKIEQHKTKKQNKQKQNQNATRELESSH